MAGFLAIHQTDASLLGCVLRQLAGKLVLGDPGEIAAGVGFTQSDDFLLRKRPLQGQPAAPERLADGVSSDAVLICAGTTRGQRGPFSEENTFPFRFKRWMFSLAGAVDSLAPCRAVLHADLPDHLKRSVRGDSASEALFFTFLSKLREAGRLDDADVDAATVARSLAAAVGQAERAFEALGQPMPGLGAVASNGRVMAAVRRGHPLWVRSQEGLDSCARCELGAGTSEHDPKKRSHRVLRAVMIASGAQPAIEGFRPLEEGEVLSVLRNLELKRVH